MAYTIGENGLLDFSNCETDEEKLDQCWDYFVENLSDTKVVAYDGRLVRGFTEVSFNHIVSGSSNKYDTALSHDIDFVERRARCLPLVGKVIQGEVKSRCYRVPGRRGKRQVVKRVLTATEGEHEYYIVVMAEVKGRYAILTAYPSSKDYCERCVRGRGVDMGAWGG